jgi:hypothetical protein
MQRKQLEAGEQKKPKVLTPAQIARKRRILDLMEDPPAASAQVRRLLSHTHGNTEAAAQLLAKMYPLV